MEEKGIGIIYQKWFCRYFTVRQTSRFTSASKKGKIVVGETVLCCAIYEISGLAEMSRFQSGILAFISNWN